MEDTYLTLSTISEGLYKEKGSKFLAFAIPVSSVSEIKSILEEKRKEFYDARHVCYAYIIGTEKQESRSNDDGEPSGTAGKPILGSLLSKQLTNVLIVVVRYFGGTKLGTSGLINAYKEASFDAIANNEIVERKIEVPIDILFDYICMNDVMRIIKEMGPTILQQEFDNQCHIFLTIRKRDYPLIYSKFKDIDGVTIKDEKQ
jgi:uncharacterized YigZ family protein